MSNNGMYRKDFKDLMKVEYLMLLLFGLLAYVTGLFGDIFVDTGKYAAISRNIAASGDLIHTTIMGEPYLQKPPFMFWLAALSFKIFGVSNFAFKLPTFLFFLLGIYATYRLGRLFYGHLTGLVGACLLAFSQAMFLYNNDTHTDTILTMLVAVSIWQFAEYLKHGRLIHYVLGFMAAGFGMITKGPIGILIPAFAIGGHLVMKRDFKTLFHPKWIPGVLIIALIVFPVLKGLYDQFGMEGLRFYFWTNNVGRITGSFAGTSNDYFFYFHTLLYIFLPWSFFTYIAFYHEIIRLIRNRFKVTASPEHVFWSGILVYIFVLSIARGKSPHYMLPLLPLIGLITAKWIVRMSRNAQYNRIFNFSVKLQLGISLVLMVCALLIPSLAFPGQKLIIWVPLLLIALFYAGLLLFTRGGRIRRFMVYPIVATIALNMAINTVLLPELNEFNAAVVASRIFNQKAPDDATLYAYKYRNFETAFYAKNQSRLMTEENMDAVLHEEGNWIFTTEEGLKDIQAAGSNFTQIDVLPSLSMSHIKLSYLSPDSRVGSASKAYLIKTELNVAAE